MDEKNSQQYDKFTNAGKGMQGVDKAPGEETASDTDQLTSASQKGKKVDADPSKTSDQPAPEK